MKIPKTLKIGTVKYKVTEEELKGFYGKTHFKEAKISLSTYVNKQFKGGTFLHEIFEIINDQYNIHMKHQTLSVVSEVLYTVLSENKLLR